MKIVYITLVAITIALCAFLFQHHAPAIIIWTNTLGKLAPVFFLLLYCLATVLFLPTMILTLAGGALFGPVNGTLINLLGASLGAACAFCISRHYMFDKVASTKNLYIKNIIHGVEGKGWQFVALLRLIPLLPFNLVNYGLGITKIKFSHYFFTTVIFLIPAEIFFTYCGYAGMDMLSHPHDFFHYNGPLFLIGISAIALIYWLLRRHRSHLLLNKQDF